MPCASSRRTCRCARTCCSRSGSCCPRPAPPRMPFSLSKKRAPRTVRLRSLGANPGAVLVGHRGPGEGDVLDRDVRPADHPDPLAGAGAVAHVRLTFGGLQDRRSARQIAQSTYSPGSMRTMSPSSATAAASLGACRLRCGPTRSTLASTRQSTPRRSRLRRAATATSGWFPLPSTCIAGARRSPENLATPLPASQTPPSLVPLGDGRRSPSEVGPIGVIAGAGRSTMRQ